MFMVSTCRLAKNFETSCFDGHYITEGITQDYLDKLEFQRSAGAKKLAKHDLTQLDLGLILAD